MKIIRTAGCRFLAFVLLAVSVTFGAPLAANAASNVAYFAVYCKQGGGLSLAFAQDNILKCHVPGGQPLFETGVSSLTTNPNGAHPVTIVEADCYPDTSQVPTIPASVTDHIDCGSSPNATLRLGSTFPPVHVAAHAAAHAARAVAHAATPPPAPTPSAVTQVSTSSLPKPQANQAELDTILSIVFGIIGALALLMITISGLRYITSAGNPEQTAKAKNGVLYALVGLAVAITAEAIVNFVVNKL